MKNTDNGEHSIADRTATNQGGGRNTSNAPTNRRDSQECQMEELCSLRKGNVLLSVMKMNSSSSSLSSKRATPPSNPSTSMNSGMKSNAISFPGDKQPISLSSSSSLELTSVEGGNTSSSSTPLGIKKQRKAVRKETKYSKMKKYLQEQEKKEREKMKSKRLLNKITNFDNSSVVLDHTKEPVHILDTPILPTDFLHYRQEEKHKQQQQNQEEQEQQKEEFSQDSTTLNSTTNLQWRFTAETSSQSPHSIPSPASLYFSSSCQSSSTTLQSNSPSSTTSSHSSNLCVFPTSSSSPFSYNHTSNQSNNSHSDEHSGNHKHQHFHSIQQEKYHHLQQQQLQEQEQQFFRYSEQNRELKNFSSERHPNYSVGFKSQTNYSPFDKSPTMETSPTTHIVDIAVKVPRNSSVAGSNGTSNNSRDNNCIGVQMNHMNMASVRRSDTDQEKEKFLAKKSSFNPPHQSSLLTVSSSSSPQDNVPRNLSKNEIPEVTGFSFRPTSLDLIPPFNIETDLSDKGNSNSQGYYQQKNHHTSQGFSLPSPSSLSGSSSSPASPPKHLPSIREITSFLSFPSSSTPSHSKKQSNE